MPATAGRVRMPANNRVHSSAALQTHGIWQSAIGYDPYAPNQDDSKKSAEQSSTLPAASGQPDGENAYASFQGLLALARLTGSNADEARGACKRCGRVGHLTFQCRNFLSIKEETIPQTMLSSGGASLEKPKVSGKGGVTEFSEDSSEEEEEESGSSDMSDEDSEIERIIAQRVGKGSLKKRSSSSKHDKRRHARRDSDSEEERKERKARKSAKVVEDDSSEDEEREKRSKGRRHKDHGRKDRKHKKSRSKHVEDSSEDNGRDKRMMEGKHRDYEEGDSDDSDEHRRVHKSKRKSSKSSREKHRKYSDSDGHEKRGKHRKQSS